MEGGKLAENKRRFTCKNMRGHKCSKGTYIGSNPLQAAKKAFSAYCRRRSRGEKCVAHFTIRETTQGSKKKSYSYNGMRQILRGQDRRDAEVTLKDGTLIRHRYKIRVKSAKKK